jgi:hypothetical protein
MSGIGPGNRMTVENLLIGGPGGQDRIIPYKPITTYLPDSYTIGLHLPEPSGDRITYTGRLTGQDSKKHRTP